MKACVITEGKGLQVPRLAFFSIKEIYFIMNVSCGKEIQSVSINKWCHLFMVRERNFSGRQILKITLIE